MKKMQRYLALVVLVCLAAMPICGMAADEDGHYFKGTFTSIMCQIDAFDQSLAMASGEVRGIVAISAILDCQSEIGEEKFPLSPTPTIYFAVGDLAEDSMRIFIIYEDATWMALISKDSGYLYVGKLEEPLSTSSSMLELIFASLKEEGSIAFYKQVSSGELLDAITTLSEALKE